MKASIYVIIAGPLRYPRSDASSNRVDCYARALRRAGVNVKVLCLRPVGKCNEVPPAGRHRGIPFFYCAGKSHYFSNIFLQLYYEIKSVIFSLLMIIRCKIKKKLDVLFLYSPHLYHEILFFFLCKILRIVYIRDICEYPFYYDRTKNLKLKLLGYIYERFFIPLYDGLICITQALENYCKAFIKKKAKILLIPIMVDSDRFKKLRKKQNDFYIAYCGNPYGNKDGVNILIEAFANIKDKFPKLKLFIIGDVLGRCPNKTLEILKQHTTNICGQNRVIFTGHVDSETVSALLMNASVLVLARPNSVQAAYGFPTKLGEYLATGNPVVVSDVGEISNYIKDGHNGFLTQPGSVSSLANKLEYLLTNPDLADQVGKEGNKLVDDYFDYRNYSERLKSFLESLIYANNNDR